MSGKLSGYIRLIPSVIGGFIVGELLSIGIGYYVPAGEQALEYRIENGEAVIEKYNGLCPFVRFPDEIEGYPVTSIESDVLENSKDYVLGAVVPGSVTKLSNAFYNSPALTAVIFEEGVRGLEFYTFYNCENLSYVKLPESLEYIGEGAFEYCFSLSEADIPDNVYYIGDYAFMECKSLSDVDIPLNAEYIGMNAFSSTAFDDALRDEYYGEDIIFHDRLLYSYGGDDENYVIPYGIETICGGAFEDAECREIFFPDTVGIIGMCAFMDCYNLNNVVLPESVYYIGNYAFESCESLEKIIVPAHAEISDTAFEDCGRLTDILYE